MRELSDQVDKAEAEYERLKEEEDKNKQDMKQIICDSRVNELTQDVVGIFIKKVKAYKGKRVEIEWNYPE